MWSAVSVAILVGGRGRRLGGQDKARLPSLRPGLSLLERQVTEFAPQVAEVLLVGRAGQTYPEVDCRLVVDRRPESGPLAALETALGAVRTPWCFLLACDMPTIEVSVLARLMAAATPAATVVALEGPRGREPLCSLYRAAVAGEVGAALARGERALYRWVAEQSLVTVALTEAEQAQLLNLNEPAALTAYRAMLSRGG